MSLKRVINEIHRRSIWQVLLIYLGASWAVLQVIDQLQTRLDMPPWVYGAALVVLLVGLPIVVATAFVQEGPEREDVPDAPARLPERVFTWRNATIGGVAAFVLFGSALFMWLRFGPNPASGGGDVATRSIAVLPFANLSPDSSDAFFAAGMHDEILTHLSRIAALDVRSRTSVLEYQNTTKNLKDIARELGVRFILEGSVRRSGDQTRITAQLIDAQTDNHMWAETYDGTRADVFAVQTAVAENIARALMAELSPAEEARIKTRPTTNSDAYDAYLKGLEYSRRSYRRADFQIAIGLLERAVELDPSFAAAHAQLSDMLSSMYWFHYDRSEALQRRAEQEAQRALDLDRNLPEAHHAIGMFYYRVRLDYDAALAELRIAQKGSPGDAQLSFNIGAVLRRKGDMHAALQSFERASKLDPLSSLVMLNLAETQMLLRNYDLAKRQLQRAAQLTPDWADPAMRIVRIYADQLGDMAAARRAFAPYARVSPEDAQYSPIFMAANLEYLDRKPDAALAVLASATEPVFKNQFFFRPRQLVIAQAYDLKSDAARARIYYDSALAVIQRELAIVPDDPRLYATRGIILAGLGRKAEAMQAGRRATELLPVEKEAWRGSFFLHELARIYAAVGEPELALDTIERLLSIPSELNQMSLKVDPAWDSLRTHPRFRALSDQ